MSSTTAKTNTCSCKTCNPKAASGCQCGPLCACGPSCPCTGGCCDEKK